METLVESRSLVKLFPIRAGFWSRTIANIHAVDNVNLSISKGETLGLVGESGCGKTTYARCLLRLIESTSGKIFFEGKEILKMKSGELRDLRSRMQMVFQDPYGSLSPRKTVLDIVGEPLLIRGMAKGNELKDRVLDLIAKVGLTQDHLYRLPHEFSGGQRQRIGVARALILHPNFVVLDEPTSALDVSVQAQILNLLKDLQKEMQLTYLFISHDLSVVKHMSSRIAVMYLAKVAEMGPTDEVFTKPVHPYTRALLSSLLIPDPQIEPSEILLKGEMDVPSPINPPSGCRFHTRCPQARPECGTREPELVEVSKGHLVACHGLR
jgi:oligopeptide/dipeptide ABC transporter ATP-binding protein